MAKGSMGKNGGATTNFDGKALAEAVVLGTAEGALASLITLQRNVHLQLSQPGTGKKHAGLRYRSSAPGRSPAVQTGMLRRSWQVGQPKRVASGRVLGWVLGSPIKYARGLEFGTRRIFPRPYLRPAIRKLLPQIGDIFSRSIWRRLKPFGASERKIR